MTRSRKIAIEVALTLGALAGVLCVVIAVAGVAFGMSPLVVRSGSMAPTIGVGDVAVARSVPADDVRVGDIVSVTRPDGARVTHRVTTIDARVGNSTTMTLRGDANSVADAEPYTVTSVDRVAFHVPKLGYVLSWFATPYVWALACLVVLGLLWVAFRPDNRWRERTHGRHSQPDRRSAVTAIAVPAIAVTVVVASAVTGYVRTSGTLAALTDTATDTGAVSAGRPIAPASLSCQTIGVLGGSARLSWPNPTASQGYDYQLTFTPSSGATPRSSSVAASTTNPVTLAVNNSYITNLFGLTLLGSFTVELRSKVGNFTSGGRLTITITVALGGVSCGSTTGTSTAAPAPLAAARQAAPTTTTTTAPTTTTTTAAPTATTSTPAPTSTVSGTPSPGGTYVATATDGVVVIRDAASGAEEYRGTGSAVSWTGPSTLRVTMTDGASAELSRTSGGQWAPAAASTTTTAPAG